MRAPEREETQATFASPSMGSGRSRMARALVRSSPAISRQEPQLEPQPVRIVSSATELTPLSAASRIW